MERKPLPPHRSAHPPVGHHAHDGAQPRRWLVLVAMTGSLAMIFVDMTVVGVALPRIGSALGMGDAGQNWIITSYLLTLASFMALGGRIGDLAGKVPAFLAGVVLFAVASAICAASRDGTGLVAGRVMQGLAACLMQPASGALVIGAFAPGERGKAMAVYVGIPLVFMAIGPALGGVVVQHWGWPWVFWMNLPIAAAAVALTLAARPRDARSADRHIDWPGGAMLVLGLPAFVFGIQQLGPERGAGAASGTGATSAGALGTSVTHASLSEEPASSASTSTMVGGSFGVEPSMGCAPGTSATSPGEHAINNATTHCPRGERLMGAMVAHPQRAGEGPFSAR